MKAILDDKGFIASFALEGEITDGIELPTPEDIDHFLAHWQSYRSKDGKALFDEEQDAALAVESEKQTLRQRRQTECFAFVNRGAALVRHAVRQTAGGVDSLVYRLAQGDRNKNHTG